MLPCIISLPFWLVQIPTFQATVGDPKLAPFPWDFRLSRRRVWTWLSSVMLSRGVSWQLTDIFIGAHYLYNLGDYSLHESTQRLIPQGIFSRLPFPFPRLKAYNHNQYWTVSLLETGLRLCTQRWRLRDEVPVRWLSYRRTPWQPLHCTKPTGSWEYGLTSSENLAHTPLVPLNPTLWCRVATSRPSARCCSTLAFPGSTSTIRQISVYLDLQAISAHGRESTEMVCRPEPAGGPARPQTRLVTAANQPDPRSRGGVGRSHQQHGNCAYIPLVNWSYRFSLLAIVNSWHIPGKQTSGLKKLGEHYLNDVITLH
jgi:hypothetical protein